MQAAKQQQKTMQVAVLEVMAKVQPPIHSSEPVGDFTQHLMNFLTTCLLIPMTHDCHCHMHTISNMNEEIAGLEACLGQLGHICKQAQLGG